MNNPKGIIPVLGHSFRYYGDEERICMRCGFVTWACADARKVKEALRDLGGGSCPGTWHGIHGKIDWKKELDDGN